MRRTFDSDDGCTTLACGDGLDACHVRERGLLGATDAEVLERAFSEARVFVTKNVGDFAKLANARELHAGIRPAR
jgi:predicted nuclease of predicted toxin-antitoxin system